MTEHEWNRPRHLFAWGIFALVTVVVASIAISAIFWASLPVPVAGTYYPFFWFPFPLFLIFGFFLFFGLLRWIFFPWRWGGGYGWGYGRRYWRYGDQAYNILRERYARGEITKDQYDQMIRDLQQHNQASY